MELRTYFRAVVRRWPLIVLFALLAGSVAYGYASRAPRLYRATAQLSVTSTDLDFFKGEAVQRLLNNYALRMRSRAFASEYAPRVAPGVGGGDVAGKVRAVAAPSEYRIGVEVDDIDPVRAQQIANAAAFSFVEKIRTEGAGREAQAITIEVLEQADIPGAPFSPRPRRDALGAVLAGALLAAVLAILLESWDDTVRSAAEARIIYGWPVLASIPSTHQRGILHVFSRRQRSRH